MSPLPAAGSLLRRPLMPCTDIMYRFFAPVSYNASTLFTGFKLLSLLIRNKPEVHKTTISQLPTLFGKKEGRLRQ